MKINFVMPGLGDSGGMKVIKRYAEALNNKGNDVVIYCPMLAYNLHRYRSLIKNSIHRVYCTGKTIVQKKDAKFVQWIWSISDKSVRNADVVIATSWPTAYDVAKLNSRKGKKFYFIQDFETWDNKKWGLNSYKLPLNKIVISTWINEQLNKKLGMGPFPVVMNGIDTNIFCDRHIRNDGSKIFLMMNHILEKKGVKNGIKVFERIKEEYPDSQLNMFGMCDNSNLPEYVRYYQNPSKEVLENLYCTANYFIFPSLKEGWGLTPIEAMACGCIVIGTNTGFVLDIGKHKKNMMISEPGDIDGMVQNSVEAIGNINLRQLIQTEMRQTIEQLNWECSYTKLEELLKKYTL